MSRSFATEFIGSRTEPLKLSIQEDRTVFVEVSTGKNIILLRKSYLVTKSQIVPIQIKP